MDDQNKTPEEEGYRSLLVINQGELGAFAYVLDCMKEWMVENNYDAETSIMRNGIGGYEIMAKRKE